jgi:hypothetical protein
MFENEGTEIESTQSDVTQESSSETQPDSQPAQQAAAPQKEEPRIPYERFQEMVQKRQEAEARMEQYEKRVAEMERRIQESQRPRDNKPDFNEVRAKMAERLKGIDPEFQSYMSLLEDQALNANKALETIREERLVENLKGKFDELAAKSSLTPALKDLYFAKMDAEYRAGNLRDAAALEKTFKAIHEPYAKHQEELKRQAIEEYTKAKKADASKPAAQPKGKAPTPGKVDLSKDPQEAKQQRNAFLVAQLRAARNI